jgi:hypothetical protein
MHCNNDPKPLGESSTCAFRAFPRITNPLELRQRSGDKLTPLDAPSTAPPLLSNSNQGAPTARSLGTPFRGAECRTLKTHLGSSAGLHACLRYPAQLSKGIKRQDLSSYRSIIWL